LLFDFDAAGLFLYFMAGLRCAAAVLAMVAGFLVARKSQAGAMVGLIHPLMLLSFLNSNLSMAVIKNIFIIGDETPARDDCLIP
jgi:hypothetical protein